MRGFVYHHTGEDLAEVLDGDRRVVYHGIDPTADSAHAGNFVNWVLLKHLHDAGHKVVFLVGGGTGLIGDPKPDSERELADIATIEARVEKLRAQAARLLGAEGITFVNNYEWLGSLELIPFLRDVGKHFTVNELLKKDAIASRLESEAGLSYTEFAYPLLQGYDYLQLFERYSCDLQVGGSDQWGNILAGVELIRRKRQATVHALTVPLIIDRVTGKKFGKSEGNAVWLDADKTSPYTFYQFWLNTGDESVIDFLKLYTFLPLTEIEVIQERFERNPGDRYAQQRLAWEVTAFVHGAASADSIARVSATLFGEVALSELNEAERSLLRENAPFHEVASGTQLVDTLVATALATSKREARTFIESGAVQLGGVKQLEDVTLTVDAFGPLTLLKRGKKQVAVVAIS